jgi:hypothetical protein
MSVEKFGLSQKKGEFDEHYNLRKKAHSKSK